METPSSASHEIPREVRELCFGGDWACTDGNLETLRFVAARLATGAPEPLHGWLLVLAAMCREDPEHAIAAWIQIKQHMLPRSQWLPS